MEKLIKIQSELKAPKKQFNKFGNYKYRNAEDILEAVKPHLKENKCTLLISDNVELLGEKLFVKATVSFNDGSDIVEVSAYAMHPISKKGMDESQITGAASSYARKYALNGLFLIDDTKDADSDEHAVQTQLPTLRRKTEAYNKVQKAISDGYSIDDVKKKYIISKEIEAELKSK